MRDPKHAEEFHPALLDCVELRNADISTITLTPSRWQEKGNFTEHNWTENKL